MSVYPNRHAAALEHTPFEDRDDMECIYALLKTLRRFTLWPLAVSGFALLVPILMNAYSLLVESVGFTLVFFVNTCGVFVSLLTPRIIGCVLRKRRKEIIREIQEFFGNAANATLDALGDFDPKTLERIRKCIPKSMEPLTKLSP